MVNCGDLPDVHDLTWASLLREKGFGVALRGADLAFLHGSDALLAHVTHLELHPDHPDLQAIKQLAACGPAAFPALVGEVAGWREFDVAAAMGINSFFPSLCMVPRRMNLSGVLGPQAALILQLMQMVQANADVRHLEDLLKRDAILSYKLFRYINSASFGIEVEIQSLRHAVTMLGYTPLFRWLSVLLAMTNVADFSPALLQAAIVRGRLTELLGQGLLSRSESDELFVVGMFSLLGQMLGVPVTQVFDQIVLPDAIVQALIARKGKYGPFMSLAESCEQSDGGSGEFADSLFITATRVNDAHLSALAWAQNIKL
jgi:c-di-GMP-related signal transduction protein